MRRPGLFTLAQGPLIPFPSFGEGAILQINAINTMTESKEWLVASVNRRRPFPHAEGPGKALQVSDPGPSRLLPDSSVNSILPSVEHATVEIKTMTRDMLAIVAIVVLLASFYILLRIFLRSCEPLPVESSCEDDGDGDNP